MLEHDLKTSETVEKTSPIIVATLAGSKSNKMALIKEEYEVTSKENVTINTVTYHGGFDSVIRLDGAYRLAEKAGLTSVTFFDILNIGHDLLLIDANAIILQLGAKAQLDLVNKQARLVAVENVVITTDEASAILEVEAI